MSGPPMCAKTMKTIFAAGTGKASTSSTMASSILGPIVALVRTPLPKGICDIRPAMAARRVRDRLVSPTLDRAVFRVSTQTLVMIVKEYACEEHRRDFEPDQGAARHRGAVRRA